MLWVKFDAGLLSIEGPGPAARTLPRVLMTARAAAPEGAYLDDSVVHSPQSFENGVGHVNRVTGDLGDELFDLKHFGF